MVTNRTTLEAIATLQAEGQALREYKANISHANRKHKKLCAYTTEVNRRANQRDAELAEERELKHRNTGEIR